MVISRATYSQHRIEAFGVRVRLVNGFKLREWKNRLCLLDLEIWKNAKTIKIDTSIEFTDVAYRFLREFVLLNSIHRLTFLSLGTLTFKVWHCAPSSTATS